MGDRCDGGAEDLVESVVLLRLEMHSDSDPSRLAAALTFYPLSSASI